MGSPRHANAQPWRSAGLRGSTGHWLLDGLIGLALALTLVSLTGCVALALSVFLVLAAVGPPGP